jgi:pyrroline-5-carboxylate reductase
LPDSFSNKEIAMKIGFIGGGNMAAAIIRGMSTQVMKEVVVSDPHDERRDYLTRNFGIQATASNKDVVSACDIIILAVKPQNMKNVLDEVGGDITGEKTVISIAAGITLDYLLSRLKTKKLVRVMPNTPALVQEGMTVISLCDCFSDRDITAVRQIFMSIGKVITLPEKYMNAVTAISGSGPAFFALFIESMLEGSMKMGLDREHATTLIVQTALGTARLLESGISPVKLREMVTSPGGTTAAGLDVFEEKNFREVVQSALDAAKTRADELGKPRSKGLE